MSPVLSAAPETGTVFNRTCDRGNCEAKEAAKVDG